MLRPAFFRPLQSVSIDARWTYIELSKLLKAGDPCRPVKALRHSTHAGKRRRMHTSTQNDSRGKLLEDYKSSICFPKATHDIKALTGDDAPVGDLVTIYGYLGERADLSKRLSFTSVLSKELDISIQVISSTSPSEDAQAGVHDRLRSIEAQSPVAVTGLLKPRKATKSDSPKVSRIQDFEIELKEVYSLNHFPKDIIVKPDTLFPPEQRHLQIRTDNHLRSNLLFRAEVAKLCRGCLEGHGFTEVETPLLFKSTPEGAREFLVPTRRKGLAYALPQSPQQYKQILMASGIPRYYQLAKCFRDEDLRADRQPEFTQLDLEMSFATGEDVMAIIETLVRKLWLEAPGKALGQVPDIQFQRLPYQEAMDSYGSDKPDLRLESKIHKIQDLIPVDLVQKITDLKEPIVEIMKVCINEDPRETRSFVDAFMSSPESKSSQENPDGGPGIFIIDSSKPLSGLQPFGFQAAEFVEDLLQLQDGDLVVLQARENKPHAGGSTSLGDLRLALHRSAVQLGHLSPPKGFEFLWVTGFPLFTPTSLSTHQPGEGQGGSAGLASTHHPFTSPKSPADVDLLFTDPLAAKADHYDLVVNGVELGGGSRRIHNAGVQEIVLRDILKVSPTRLEEFRHLLEVLRAGCPPHAGIALGFDRLVAMMLGRESVRDVIAFPKSGRGEDLLVKCPGVMSDESLETYHLRVQKD